MVSQAIQVVSDDFSLDLPDSTAQHVRWLDTAGALLSRWVEAENFTVMRQAEILYNIHKNWTRLSFDATSKYNHEFKEWARSFTPDGVRQSDATVRNKIGVYRDFVATKRIEPPKIVDSEGNEVEFDPMNVRFSKLLLAKHSAKSGQLTDDGWKALADSSKSVTELKAAMRGAKDEYPQDYSPSIAFYVNDDVIIAKGADTSVAVAVIDRENAGTKAWEDALDALTSMLGAIDFSIPESELSSDDVPLLSIQGDSVMISKNGVGINLSMDELKSLVDILGG